MKYKIYSLTKKKKQIDKEMEGISKLAKEINQDYSDIRIVKDLLCTLDLPINNDDYHYTDENNSIDDVIDSRVKSLAKKMYPNKDLRIDRVEINHVILD